METDALIRTVAWCALTWMTLSLFVLGSIRRSLQTLAEKSIPSTTGIERELREIRDLMPRREVPWEPRFQPSGVAKTTMPAPIIFPENWNLPPGTSVPK